MSRKKKPDTADTTIAPESHLAAPALTPSEVAPPLPETPRPEPDAPPAEIPAFPPPPITAWKWPQSTERRDLLVAFTEADRSDIAGKFAVIVAQKDNVEDEKKSEASRFKAIIDNLDERLTKLSCAINANGETRLVNCTWVWEVSGRDTDTGAWVENPDYKTLVRNDTGEVVAATRITESDRQANLELPDTTEADLDALLMAHGYRVDVLTDPEELQSPFQLVEIATGAMSDLWNVESKLAALLAVSLMDHYVATAHADSPVPDHTESELDLGESPDPDPPLEDIKDDGRAARRAKKGRNTAPYGPGTPERQAWRDGWDEADTHEPAPLKSAS